jgi:RND family efflux transporter MFP subunit
MEEAKAEYQSSKAILNTKKTSLDYLSVKAPFSGYITKRYVDKGALVQSALNNQSAQAIFELQDISKLRLVVDFPESDVELISKGQEVQVEFPELNSEPLIAHVDRLANALDMSTKTMRVEIDIQNKTGLFKPGMYAKLRIALKDHGSLSVPLLSISGKKGDNYIYIVRSNIVSKMGVSLGLEDKEYIEVLNNDLNENDLVIIKGKEMVSEGINVQTKLN